MNHFLKWKPHDLNIAMKLWGKTLPIEWLNILYIFFSIFIGSMYIFYRGHGNLLCFHHGQWVYFRMMNDE
ncbi:hypothetical protein M2407_005262 [Serratia sp. BIGb0234]|nr:hypothetical protein [Serratia sp. BIGb0234]